MFKLLALYRLFISLKIMNENRMKIILEKKKILKSKFYEFYQIFNKIVIKHVPNSPIQSLEHVQL